MADRKFVVLEWLVQKLSVARKKGDRQAEGLACFDLGIYYQGAADFNQAIISYTEALAIFTEIGFRVGEGGAYGNLGIAYKSLGDFKQAIAYHNQRLRIAKELGDRAGEGRAYGNLGIAYRSLGDFKQVIAYLNEDLSIAKELGDRAGEGAAYGNLGLAYQSLGDFKQALAYHNQNLSICKEMEDPIGLAIACYNIGLVHEIFYSFSKALNYFSLSIHYFDETRRLLQAEEAWKISFRDKNKIAYTALWTALLKNGEVDEALYAAELGRTQALADILKMQYGVDEKPTIKVTIPLVMKDLPSQTVFTALEGNTISFWLLREDIGINFRQKKIENGSANSLLKSTLKQINAGTVERCENRSLDRQRSDFSSSREAVEETVQSLSFSVHSLQPLYDVLVSPIADLLQGDDLVFVPDGDFCLAPFSALSDSVRIRAIPSLTALKLIAIATDDFQSKNEALLVGDPCLKEVTHGTGESMYGQLPCAKKEVYMIGKLLQTAPLTGKNATKAEVLKRMKSVDLIHIAAHGDDASGEIALAPNPERTSQVPKEEDYILSLSDVQAVRLQARLVVLSCSHSGQGEVKSEGIVGVARAFLCAGARSVLASLWAIDDEATLMFMKRFYKHLADRKSACRALHHAMKSLRETKNYSAIKHWAPFVLIGDDVTFEFGKHEHKKNASSHGNVDDISDDSDIHPVIAVAGDDDDDDEVGYEEGKEEERGGNKHEEDEEKELEGNEDEVALEAERIDTLGLEHHENKGGDIGEGVIQAVVEDFKLEQHEREESVEEDPIKTRIYEGTVTSEGIRLHLKLGAVHLTFPPDAMSEPTPIMVHRWKCNALSPPLGEHEAVVSNVIEIYTNTVAEAFEFNKEVRLALSHSAPNLKGYELVIKRLVDAETNEWEDVDGSEDFQCPSDIVDDYSSPNDIPDSCFPVVQAGITKCSTYAVVCRLKLSPAYTITVNGGTYSHPDYPDVIIAVPKKAIPNKTKLPLQLKVQEVLQDEFNGLDLCSGPILRILGSPSAEFLRPVTIQLPITHGLDPEYIPDPSVCRVRIFFLTSDGESKEWIEITSDLENPASFDGNFVKFQVRRFSGYTCFVDWCKEEIRSNASRIITYLSSLIWNQPREANFFAYFQPAERLNSQDILFLICYPVHLREMVKQEHVKEGITFCHVSSRRKMIPGQDKAFVFVSGGMCPVSLKGMDDFYLRFDGNAPFDAQVRVRLISDQEYCKVDFRSTRESTGNNLLSTLFLKLDHQEHKKRFFDKSISSPEEGGEDLKQTGDRLLEDSRFSVEPVVKTATEPII